MGSPLVNGAMISCNRPGNPGLISAGLLRPAPLALILPFSFFPAVTSFLPLTTVFLAMPVAMDTMPMPPCPMESHSLPAQSLFHNSFMVPEILSYRSLTSFMSLSFLSGSMRQSAVEYGRVEIVI
ncbi:MAG: hypothetical protein M1476_01075 [Candidatus Thermoplasmatota archaeon]|nr:hypothetical protein [Candidatus Thermoplasmatota archaeon]